MACLSFSVLPRAQWREAEPSFGQLHQWVSPHLFQQLEANWPVLIREVELGEGGTGGTPPPWRKEAKPSTSPL